MVANISRLKIDFRKLFQKSLKVEVSAMMFVLWCQLGEDDSNHPINCNKGGDSCGQYSIAPPEKPEFSDESNL